MATLVIEINEQESLKEIKKLAAKMGATITSFTKNEEEDFKLGRVMKKSEKSGKGNLDTFFKFVGIK